MAGRSPANETAYGGRLQATCSRSDNGRQRVIDARLRMASGREFAVAYTARVHGMFRQRIEARMTMTFGDAGQPFTPLEQPEADTWSGNGLNDRKRWSDEAMRALCAVVDTASLISHGVAAEVLSRQIDHLIACTDAIGAPELEPAQEPNEPEAEAPAP